MGYLEFKALQRYAALFAVAPARHAFVFIERLREYVEQFGIE
jgi:hypothetical protein